MRAKLISVLLSAVLAAPALASEPKEPPVPPGLTAPGAVMVALLGPGIDYRLPEFKGRLARDGEGDLISWDFSDGDNKPFAEGGVGTEVAKIMAGLAPQAQLVIVRERIGDRQAFGHMMTFVGNTPARIVVWLDGENVVRPDWSILAQAVERFHDHLFIIPITERLLRQDLTSAYDSIRSRPNAVIVAAGNAGVGGPEIADISVWASARDDVPARRYAALVIAALAARAVALRAHLKRSSRSPEVIKLLVTAVQPVGIARNRQGLRVVLEADIEKAFRLPDMPR